MSTSSGNSPKFDDDSDDQISAAEYLGGHDTEEAATTAAEGATLESASEDEVKEPAGPSDEPKLRARRWYVVALVVLLVGALVTVSAVYFYARSSANEPAQTVEDFLEAVHDRDFDAALDFVSESSMPRSPVTVAGPETLRSDWEIGDVEVIHYSEEPVNDTAEVRAEIIGPDDTSVSSVLNLVQESDEWKIRNAFTHVSFPARIFEYFQVNGVDVEIVDDEHPSPPVVFLPGVYEYYGDDMEMLEPVFDSVVKLGGESSPVNVKDGHEFAPFTSKAHDEDPAHLMNDNFILRDDAEDTAQQRTEEYIEECLGDGTTLDTFGCPISVDTIALARAVEDDTIDPLFSTAEAEWDIQEYPKTAVIYDARPQHEGALQFANETPGLVELSTSVEDFNTGETHELRFECDINVEQLIPHLDDKGNFHIGPLEPSNNPPEGSSNYLSHMDCTHVE